MFFVDMQFIISFLLQMMNGPNSTSTGSKDPTAPSSGQKRPPEPDQRPNGSM